jgi:hypothetical protein
MPESSKPKTDYYARFLSELDELLRHKYFRSEQEGRDIGFEKALTEWHRDHRARWIETLKKA